MVRLFPLLYFAVFPSLTQRVRTCATPEFLKGEERPKIFPDDKSDEEEWKLLYEAARNLIGVSSTEFDQSIRHNTVLNTLKKAFPDRGIKPLPLACHRVVKGSPYVMWHSAENVRTPNLRKYSREF